MCKGIRMYTIILIIAFGCHFIDASTSPNNLVPLFKVNRIYDNYNLLATEADANLAISNYGFASKTVIGSVASSADPNFANQFLSIHRMYKANSTGNDDHLFTYSKSEVNLAVNTVGYRYENVRFYCAVDVNDLNAAVPLHRYWTGVRHFYTTKIVEGNAILLAGGKYEDILCYIWQ